MSLQEGYPYNMGNMRGMGQVPQAEAPGEVGTFYVIQLTLTAAAGITVSTLPAIPIGGYLFRWEQLGGKWNLTAVSPPDGDWDIRISDTAGNKYFSPDYMSVNALLGGVEREPYKLPYPYTFPANSGIMVEAINRGLGVDTLTLTFIGKRIESGGG